PGNDDAFRSVKLIASAIADAVIEAREGVSLNKNTDEDEEIVDMNAVLADVKPTETKEEDEVKPVKKTRAKKAVKVEESKETTTEVSAEEATEEEKPAKKTRAKKQVKSTEKEEPKGE